MRLTACLLLLAGTVLCVPVSAQGWSVLALHHVEVLGAGRPAWQTTRLGVLHRGPAGAVGIETARVMRDDRADVTVAADVYRVLSRRVYANVRADVTPDATVVPTLSLSGEVYASPLRAWEGSVGARYLAVPGTDVPLVTASITRYVWPAITLGVRSTVALRPATSVSTLFTARFLPEPTGHGPSTRVTLSIGQEQEAVTRTGGAVEVRRQSVAVLSGQRALWGQVGVLGGVSVASDGAQRRWSAEAGVSVQL